MQRSTKTFAAVAAAVAAATAVAIPVTAGAKGRSHDGATRLTLIESSDAFHFIDAPAAEADGQAGDVITFESTLRTRGGDVAGRLEGSCIQIRADGTLDDCAVTVTLGKGSYRMAGPFDPTSGGTLAILGGTGAFVGAAGTDTIANQADGTAIHTIRIVRD